MSKKIRSGVIYILVILLLFACGDKKDDIRSNKEYCKCQGADIKSWKYGFVLDKSNNVIYYDPELNAKSNFKISYFTKSDEEVEKSEGNIIYADKIQIHPNRIYVMNHKKDRRGVSIGEDLEMHYKIENCRNWISKDGKNWEVLEIKYLKETQEKNWLGEPLILVYFKCSYFEGEYYITSRL